MTAVMGELRSRGQRLPVSDRELAHLMVVVRRRFAEHGSFALTWTVPTSEGSGRRSIWLSSQVPLMFHFRHSRTPAIDAELLHEMLTASYRPDGVYVTADLV